jgi:anti-sigma regulatory factor (Ser/Thr protein kinase)
MPTQSTPTPLSSTLRYSPRNLRSVTRARHAFRDAAAGWGLCEEMADTAELLLSELVTNACRHAKSPEGRYITVSWTLTPPAGLLRLEVADANRRLPAPRTAAPDDECGRGLELLAALATDWGVSDRPLGVGKVVWVELKLPASRTD